MILYLSTFYSSLHLLFPFLSLNNVHIRSLFLFFLKIERDIYLRLLFFCLWYGIRNRWYVSPIAKTLRVLYTYLVYCICLEKKSFWCIFCCNWMPFMCNIQRVRNRKRSATKGKRKVKYRCIILCLYKEIAIDQNPLLYIYTIGLWWFTCNVLMVTINKRKLPTTYLLVQSSWKES